jgi:hypothetical protein
MAVITPSRWNAGTGTAGWDYGPLPAYFLEDAQGKEGQSVDCRAAHAAEQWRGASAYVSAMFAKASLPARSNWYLTAAAGFAAACAACTASAVAFGLGTALSLPAAAFGYAAYVSFMQWVARNRNRSRWLYFADRVRRALAYEGDPGPRK